MSDKNKTFSTISLFFRSGVNPESSKLNSILGHLHLIDKKIMGNNLSFNLDDKNYADVKEVLVKLLDLLDENKRSQAMIFSDDGMVHCITINNNELKELAA